MKSLTLFALLLMSGMAHAKTAPIVAKLKACFDKGTELLKPVDAFIVEEGAKAGDGRMDYRNGVFAGSAVGTFTSIEAALMAYCKGLYN
jgi:hypothetical protein